MLHTPKDGTLKTPEEEYEPPSMEEVITGNRVERVRYEENPPGRYWTILVFETGHEVYFEGDTLTVHPSHVTFPN